MFDAGMRVQPSTPASPRLAPSSFTKPRRPTPSGSTPSGPPPPRRRTISSRGALTTGSSPVTRGARRQPLDAIARGNCCATFGISTLPALDPRVSEPEEARWRAVAVQAPLHRQRRGLIDLLHHVDRTMACVARHAVAQVHSVVEEHKVG